MINHSYARHVRLGRCEYLYRDGTLNGQDYADMGDGDINMEIMGGPKDIDDARVILREIRRRLVQYDRMKVELAEALEKKEEAQDER